MSKIISGKEVLTTLEELILLQHTALIMVDPQNDFCIPGGYLSQLETSNMEMIKTCVDHMAELLVVARQVGIMIIYTQQTNDPNHVFRSSPSLAWVTDSSKSKSPLICIAGEWGYQIVDKLKPLPSEIIIKKHRHSSFMGTELDMLLRSNKIKTLIITGVTTDRCVLATICGAIAHDYYVVVPEDCVASQNIEMHNAALSVISGNILKVGMTNAAKIINIWQQSLPSL